MRRFRYPYQKIVDLKSSEKTQAEWLLAAAVGKLQQEEQLLGKLLAERAAWLERMQSEAGAGANLAELQLMQTYVDYLDSAIAKKEEDVRLARQEKQRRQETLADRMVDEKVWLKAKEKSFLNFKHEEQRREQNELDEIAAVRFVFAAD